MPIHVQLVNFTNVTHAAGTGLVINVSWTVVLPPAFSTKGRRKSYNAIIELF